MKLAFVTRLDAFVHRGGDTVQLERTAAELRTLGHQVDVFTGTRSALAQRYDLVHVFNLQRPGETWAQLRRALPAHRVALSPIYGDTSQLDRRGRSLGRRVLTAATPGRVLELAKQGRRVAHGVGEWESLPSLVTASPEGLRRRILRHCVGIYPNSRWEAAGLVDLLDDWQRERIEVVPNGVDLSLLERGGSAEEFRQRWSIDWPRFIVSVARFDERKNNLGLVRAAVAADVPLLLIGRPAPMHVGYFERCQQEAARSDKVRIVTEPMSQEQLIGAYRAAWTHALPSWLETPGLVSLEAGLCGANLVVGDCPPVREYFDDGAWYVPPGDETAIANALVASLAAPRNVHRFDDVVARRYSWRSVALRQLDCYERALARPRP